MATGYQSGYDILANIIDNIADTLITNYSGWSDGDTNWNTTKRCLVYDYGGATQQYFTLEVINTSTMVYGKYSKGLRLQTCDTWDSVNHVIGSGYYSTLIPFERTSSGSVSADLSTLNLTYYLWIDSSGFVIMAKPEPNSSDNYQQSFILSLEKIGTKEYTDSALDFTIFTVCNINPVSYSYGDTNDTKNRALLRFDKYQWPDDSNLHTESPEGHGIDFYLNGFVSDGNSKVYYVKPVFNNTVDSSKDMICQLDNFFKWDEGKGLVDGDIVQIESSTTKYICKSLDSPDSTNRLNYAIKYVA